MGILTNRGFITTETSTNAEAPLGSPDTDGEPEMQRAGNPAPHALVTRVQFLCVCMLANMGVLTNRGFITTEMSTNAEAPLRSPDTDDELEMQRAAKSGPPANTLESFP